MTSISSLSPLPKFSNGSKKVLDPKLHTTKQVKRYTQLVVSDDSDLSLLGRLGCLGWRLGFLGCSCLLTLLRQQYRVNIGQNTAVGNGDSGKQLSELLIVPYCQKNVSRVDSVFLVVSSCIACKLENLYKIK